MNDHVSIINFTYYNLYGDMMRGKYYINITLHFLYFKLLIYALSLHYVPLIVYFFVLKMNSIQSNVGLYTYFLVDLN